ncbi:DUF6150 family protein [Pontibacter sp. G13]|uniref:DUF6150 family protein n=1 Tax=Pontibacter sp. G13 TaxID=3074898 RepID=UPI002889CBF5|nr:DUF6150 family protein [Pontibacter sp. G13]WNJ21078.1 DUF6150 family protein [Pontibacter sp. G13]
MLSIFSALMTAMTVMFATPTEPQPTSAPTPPDDLCEVYGTVFIETVPAFADYRVFVSDMEGFADLVVFKQDAELFADRAGHWYFTDIKAIADFTVYVEQVESFADFTIAYTDFQSAAGCR